MSSSLWPHGLQHTRPPCPSPSPRVCSSSCPLSQWCHPIISSSVIPFFFLPSVFPSIKVFSNESALCIKWPKYWRFSFSISPSSECSGLLCFRESLFYNVVSFCSAAVDQAYACIYPLSFEFPSRLGHHRAPSRSPCAMQWVLIACLFYS